MRLIALLLAIVMMAGTGVQVHVLADVSSAVEDLPDLVTPVVPQWVAVPRPDRRIPARIEAPPSTSRGREHAVLIFRPPRLVASR